MGWWNPFEKRAPKITVSYWLRPWDENFTDVTYLVSGPNWFVFEPSQVEPARLIEDGLSMGTISSPKPAERRLVRARYRYGENEVAVYSDPKDARVAERMLGFLVAMKLVEQVREWCLMTQT